MSSICHMTDQRLAESLHVSECEVSNISEDILSEILSHLPMKLRPNMNPNQCPFVRWVVSVAIRSVLLDYAVRCSALVAVMTCLEIGKTHGQWTPKLLCRLWEDFLWPTSALVPVGKNKIYPRSVSTESGPQGFSMQGFHRKPNMEDAYHLGSGWHGYGDVLSYALFRKELLPTSFAKLMSPAPFAQTMYWLAKRSRQQSLVMTVVYMRHCLCAPW